jgi:PQQ-like domain
LYVHPRRHGRRTSPHRAAARRARRLALAAALLAACSGRGAPPPPGTGSGSASHGAGSGEPPPTAASEPPRPVTRAPHGAAIDLLAVTEAGDAAISADTQHGLRLWPSLDGKREPVVVRGAPPRQLAIARHAAGFVVALLDHAGGGEILDLDRDGGLRTRGALPVEPALVQLVALATGVLARRSDHTVLWLDVAGRVRGTITAQPSEQIVTLATRRGAALAGLADRQGPSVTRLRWLDIGAKLAWGKAVTLPEPLDAAIALAPGGRRIAGATPRRDRAVMIDLEPAPRTIKQRALATSLPRIAVGFASDDFAIVSDGSILRSSDDDPQASLAGHVDPATPGAVFDSGVVLGYEAGLDRSEVTELGIENTHHLGYRDHAIGDLHATASHITHEYDGRVYWLDRNLVATRALDASFADNGGVIVLDDQHVLQRIHMFPDDMRGPEPGSRLVLKDAATGREHPLGTWPGDNAAYEPSTRVLALVGDKAAVRLRLDLDQPAATPLPPLVTRELSTAVLFDPAAASGLCAITVGPEVNNRPGGRSGTRVEWFVEQPPGTRQIKPSHSKLFENAWPIAADQAGRLYVHDGTSIALYERSTRKRAFPIEPGLHSGTSFNGVGVDPAGTTLALIDPASVVALDAATGAVRWRAPAWRPKATVFSRDGKIVVARLEGGVLALDAATGKQLATACGWGFTLTRDRPRTSMLGTPVLCAGE